MRRDDARRAELDPDGRRFVGTGGRSHGDKVTPPLRPPVDCVVLLDGVRVPEPRPTLNRVPAVPAREGEIVVPFPGASSVRMQPVTAFRSTWLSSSVRSLRARGLADTYFAALPREHHDLVLGTVVGTWLPVHVAMAHYFACDALNLPTLEIVEIGREAAGHVHGSTVATLTRLARGAGVTPWAVLTRLDELWKRIWHGGGVCVRKQGPKEARVEIAGWPCAKSAYCRAGLRGVLLGLTEPLAVRAYAREFALPASRVGMVCDLSWV